MYPQISMRTMTLSTSALPARTGPADSSRPSSSCWPASRASPSSSSSPCSSASSSARSRSILSWPVYLYPLFRLGAAPGLWGRGRRESTRPPPQPRPSRRGSWWRSHSFTRRTPRRSWTAWRGRVDRAESPRADTDRLYPRCRTGVCACLRLHPLQLPAPHLCRQTD